MNGDRAGSGPDQGSGSWASEALPMSVRKELLERELHKLGFRKASSGSSAAASESHGGDSRSGDQAHPHAAGDGEPHGG